MGLRTILYGYRKEQFEYFIVTEEAENVRKKLIFLKIFLAK